MLASPAPTSVEANEPFTIQLKMVNATGHTITSSFNSGLEIMCQVAYTHKWFERVGGLWLAQTDAVLKGDDVVTSVINDKVIFARFKNGLVRFNFVSFNLSQPLSYFSGTSFYKFTHNFFPKSFFL